LQGLKLKVRQDQNAASIPTERVRLVRMATGRKEGLARQEEMTVMPRYT
jgi:hypothetical protein